MVKDPKSLYDMQRATHEGPPNHNPPIMILKAQNTGLGSLSDKLQEMQILAGSSVIVDVPMTPTPGNGMAQPLFSPYIHFYG